MKKNRFVCCLMLIIIPNILAISIWEEKRDNSIVFCDDGANGLVPWTYEQYHRYITHGPCYLPSFEEKNMYPKMDYWVSWGSLYHGSGNDELWSRMDGYAMKLAHTRIRFNVNLTNTTYSYGLTNCNSTDWSDKFHCDRAIKIINEPNNLLICSTVDQQCETLHRLS